MAQQQSQGQPQWAFWTPWAYHQAQGPPPSGPAAGSSRRSSTPSATPLTAPPPGSGSPMASGPRPPVIGQGEPGAQMTEETIPSRDFSSSSPDEALADPAPQPPSMDSRPHQELLRRLAVNLAVQHEEVHEDLDPMVDIIAAAGPGRVALPLNKTVDKLSKTLWQTPASIAPTQKGVERRYYVPQEGHEYLFTHPAPGSIVVQAAAQKERQGPPGPTPKAKEPRRLDLLGRKAYATGGLQLRIANQQLMLRRYAFNMWASTQKFASQLPPESRQEFGALTEEGQAVVRTSLQAALDAADLAARTMATGVVMRRSAWLQVSGIPPEVQTTIQDLPFEGPALFSEQTDSKLHSLKDSRTYPGASEALFPGQALP
nr:uncharacterized protein LOC112547842 [Pelodiscus sinensis]|eukprot:XP_025046829.1 uncharacterized protein LOC112547842 [Pelodiscus sinensis]